jgi:hypothetical protein
VPEELVLEEMLLDSKWIARATRSFPVPLSPSIRTVVASLFEILETRSQIFFIAGASPTILVLRKDSSSPRRKASSWFSRAMPVLSRSMASTISCIS